VGIPVVLDVGESGQRPRPELERAAWRVAQVALDNAVRHAAPSQISIAVSVAADHVALAVADDGRGLDPADAIRPGARGLADLTRRAASVGANVSVGRGADGGTVVRFEWRAVRAAARNDASAARRA
jgi:signal transduction histidine kinase